MDQKILVFAGKKQSGKSSAAHFVAGYLLSQLGRKGQPFCPIKFTMDDEGRLIVNTAILQVDGQVELTDGILDLNRRDIDFVTWALNVMWANVKLYSFADSLKEIATHVFGIPEELVYGNDDAKRQTTHIKWKDMCYLLLPRHVQSIKKGGLYDQNMSVRQFLQYFGTNVCRRIYNDCWTNNCFKNILEDSSELAIIQDCRFESEVKQSKKFNAKIIKLTREIDGADMHDSETGLDKMSNNSYDLVIDNQYMTIKEKNQAILDALYSWEWLSGHIDLES